MRQRTTRTAPPAVFHVAGVRNTLEDVASRVIPGVPPMETTPGSLCPVEFLTHFDSSYPLQPQLSWTNVQPPSDLWSNVIATLCTRLQLPLHRWTTSPGRKAASQNGPIIPGKDPWLRGYSTKALKQECLLSFAARVRTGVFGRAVQVGHQSVEKVLRHVAQTIVLAGYDDPRQTQGCNKLDLPFTCLLAAYRQADPLPQSQLVLPVNTVKAASAYYQLADARTRVAGDLVTVAFFFLLRVGEYTMPRPNLRTRTVQFRVQDVMFRHDNGTVVANTAPLPVLAAAELVTLFLDNQKNGQRGTTILHTSTGSWFCPVQALTRRVASVMAFNVPMSTPLSFVRPGSHVSAIHVTALVRQAAVTTNLMAQGYDMRRIGRTHSLRASGAMALKLQGAEDSTIMKIGRWSGTSTYLTYIHSQIGALNAGLTVRMAVQIHFVNVGTTMR
jgi:hypothetical protein